MAQIVQLKRNNVAGQIPTTSSLVMGELAMNTYDGRIFFKRSGSVITMESLLSPSINSSYPIWNTGSLYLSGSIYISDSLTSVGFISGSDFYFGVTSVSSSLSLKNALLSGSGFLKLTSGVPSYITGSSTQFVKANGTLDGNTYLTATTGVTSFNSRTGSVSLTFADITSSIANNVLQLPEAIKSDNYIQAGRDATASPNAGFIFIDRANGASSWSLSSTNGTASLFAGGTYNTVVRFNQNGITTFPNLGTGIAHLSSTGDLSSSPIVNADITNATIDLTTKVTGILPVSNGGTGTGSFSSNYLLKGGGTGSLQNSQIFDNGTNVYITGSLVSNAGNFVVSRGYGIDLTNSMQSYLTSDASTNVKLGSSGYIAFLAGGAGTTEYGRITNDGKFLWKRTSSNYDFDVSGSGNFSSNLSVSGTIGIGITATASLHITGSGKIQIGTPDVGATNGIGFEITSNIPQIKFRNSGNYTAALRQNGYELESWNYNGNARGGIIANYLKTSRIINESDYYVADVLGGQLRVGGWGYAVEPLVVRGTSYAYPFDIAQFQNSTPTNLVRILYDGRMTVAGGTDNGYGLDVNGTGRFVGALKIDATTASTSTTTGALVVSGGLGVGGSAVANLFDGKKFQNSTGVDTFTGGNGNGQFQIYGTTLNGMVLAAGGTSTAFTFANNSGTSLFSITSAGVVNVPATTASTSSTTGALIVSGGLGVAGAGYFGGNLQNISTTGDSSLTLQTNVTGSASSWVRYVRSQTGYEQSWRVGCGIVGSGDRRFTFYDETNSTFRFSIDTSGNVGINTYNPTDPLSIYSSTESRVRLYNTSGTNKQNRIVFSTGTGTGNIQYQMGTDYNGINVTDFFVSRQGASNPVLYADASDLVGLGNTTPQYKLDVTGTGRFTSTLNVITSGTQSTSQSLFKINADAGFGAVDLLQIFANGDFQFKNRFGANILNYYAASDYINATSTDIRSRGTINSLFNYSPTYGGYNYQTRTLNFDNSTGVLLTSTTASDKILQIKGAVSQSANLTEWQNSAGTALVSVASNGALTVGSTTASTSTTTGALIVSGGLGVGGNINAADITGVNISATNRFISSNYVSSDNGSTNKINFSGNITTFWNNNTETARFTANNRFLFKTTTDAGFDFDINGTARIAGQLNVNGNIIGNASTAYTGIVSSLTPAIGIRSDTGISNHNDGNVNALAFINYGNLVGQINGYSHDRQFIVHNPSGGSIWFGGQGSGATENTSYWHQSLAGKNYLVSFNRDLRIGTTDGYNSYIFNGDGNNPLVSFLYRKVGFGITPTAVLHLKAGTATANTAPFKFTTSGSVLLTTPEAGVMEVDSSGVLYYTPVSTRKTIAFTDSVITGTVASLTTGRTISITGDLTYTSPAFDGSGNVTAAGTLATVNSNVGTFGSTTQVGIFTVNAKGLITSASNVTIDLSAYLTSASAASTYQPLNSNLTTIAGLTATTNNFIVSVGGAWASRTPTQVKATLAITNTDVSGLGTLATQNGTFSGTSSGTNTGDNAVNTLYSGLVTNATHTGDATGSGSLTVVGINGTLLSGLATGILKNTTSTGVPSIAVQSDITALLGAGSITNTMLVNGAVANLSGTNTGDQTITLTGAVTGSGTGSFATTLASAIVGISNLSATGTPSSTTYLRGDNTWATVSGGSFNGSGVNNYIAKFSGSVYATSSLIYDNGTNVGIGNTNSIYNLDVTGTGRFTSNLSITGSVLTNSIVTNSGIVISAISSSAFIQLLTSQSLGFKIGSYSTYPNNSIIWGAGITPALSNFAFSVNDTATDTTINTTTSGSIYMTADASDIFAIFRRNNTLIRRLVVSNKDDDGGVGDYQFKISPSSAVLTTPEDGVLEYEGTHLYFTIGSTRYQLDQQGGSIGDGDKGDITVSSSGTVWTIDSGSVTLAKMANMATTSLIGRSTAGTGVPEVLSASTAKTLLSLNNVENTALSTWTGSINISTVGTITTGTWSGTSIAVNKGGTNLTSYAVGDLIYASASTTLSKLAAVSSGQFLKSAGVTTAPVWGTISESDLPNQAGIAWTTYSDTITWNGTAPSGAAAHEYRYYRIGKMVFGFIRIRYNTAGANNTTLTLKTNSFPPISVPSDASTYTDYITSCTGILDTADSGSPPATRCWIEFANETSNFVIKFIAGTQSAKFAMCSFTYLTA